MNIQYDSEIVNERRPVGQAATVQLANSQRYEYLQDGEKCGESWQDFCTAVGDRAAHARLDKVFINNVLANVMGIDAKNTAGGTSPPAVLPGRKRHRNTLHFTF